MCAAAINLTSKALGDVNNAEVILEIKTLISLFIQTMEVYSHRKACPPPKAHVANNSKGWGYSVSTLDTFLLKLFDKYAELLKRRFSEDFHEVCRCPTSAPFTLAIMLTSA